MERTEDLATTTEDLGWRVASDGVNAHFPAVRRIIRRARTLGVGRIAADVVADHAAPEVARQRAFAVMTKELAAASARQLGRVA